jgi:hypothetical protein
MYVPQEELDAAYNKDRQRFVEALVKLGVTEPTPDGSAQSMLAPGNAELVTYFGDKYEDELDFEALAAEFDMKPDEFSATIKRVEDADVLRLGLDWVTTLEAGGTIPRAEVEQQFPLLLSPLMQLKALDTTTVKVAATAQAKEVAGQTAQQTPVKAETIAQATPAYRQEKPAEGKLELALQVASTTAKVGDQLSFELSSNKACELQVLYVEETGNVEVIPDAMIGNTTLQAGEKRLIPQPGTGNLTFDTPAPAETMIAYCREGGLGDQKLTVERARQLVAESHLPPTRGLAINLAKKAEDDKGASGLQVVTFEIKQ